MDRKSCQLTNQVSLVRDSTRGSSWFCMPVTKSIETFFAAVVESSLHHVRLHREEESARLSLPKALPRERMVSSAKSRRASGAPSKWSYGVGPPSLHKSPLVKFQYVFVASIPSKSRTDAESNRLSVAQRGASPETAPATARSQASERRRLLASGEVESRAALARHVGVSRARVTQVLRPAAASRRPFHQLSRCQLLEAPVKTTPRSTTVLPEAPPYLGSRPP